MGAVTTTCMKMKPANRFVQSHVFARSPPGRHLSHKYPVNTSQRSTFVSKMFHSRYYLVATTILVQSLRSQICALTHVIHNIGALVGQNK